MHWVENAFVSSITDQKIQREYLQSRSANLSAAKQFRRKEGIGKDEQSLFFGQHAFDNFSICPQKAILSNHPNHF
jgi:hypothetical protein